MCNWNLLHWGKRRAQMGTDQGGGGLQYSLCLKSSWGACGQFPTASAVFGFCLSSLCLESTTTVLCATIVDPNIDSENYVEYDKLSGPCLLRLL